MKRIHRHRPSRLARKKARMEALKPFAAFAIVGVVLLWIGSWFVGIFDFGGQMQYTGVVAKAEEQSSIQVSLDGGEWKRSDAEVKLYQGDAVGTAAQNFARLKFFDRSSIRLNEESNVRIVESTRSDTESQWSVHMENGTIWVSTTDADSFTGSIKRFVSTVSLQADFPPSTEAVVKDNTVTVFKADGIGATVSILDSGQSLIVGEGQTFSLPEGGATQEDLYAYRKALDPQAVSTPFVTASRELVSLEPVTPTEDGDQPTLPVADDTGLTIETPADRETVNASTIDINGRVSSSVETVRINGYAAQLNKDEGTYSLKLALPDEDEVRIAVEAISTEGEVSERKQVTVLRDREPPESPGFVSPAKTGQTYKTNREQFEIVGTAPKGAVGIVVNGYRLQFFKPGDTTWKYLANAKLGNMQRGINEFKAVAINAGGYESEPAVVTIILGDEVGLVTDPDELEGTAAEGSASSASSEATPAELPDNAPLFPGTLRVTGPTEGSSHTATGSSMLIEGIAPEGTVSVWVNDYRLRLFNAQRGYWNYIADTNLGTLSRGRNSYKITARNAEQQIIDTTTYVITYNP